MKDINPLVPSCGIGSSSIDPLVSEGEQAVLIKVLNLLTTERGERDDPQYGMSLMQYKFSVPTDANALSIQNDFQNQSARYLAPDGILVVWQKTKVIPHRAVENPFYQFNTVVISRTLNIEIPVAYQFQTEAA